MVGEIVCDDEGQPVKVVISYDEYQDMLSRIESADLLRKKLMEFRHFLGDVLELAPVDQDSSDDEMASAENGDAESAQPPLPEEEPCGTIREYEGARGYYVDDNCFRILKGSLAVRYTSSTFDESSRHAQLRQKLMEDGILVEDHALGPYRFTRHYLFRSSSAAACIVTGQSRSGPELFGDP